jgi:serine/threonine protein kinase
MEKPDIPDFKIISCCGSGAYGDVWVADDRDGIRRAVKVLNKERLTNLGVLGREEKALRLFRSRVPEHPNLIKIFHSGETDPLIYYVMELADNSNPGGSQYEADTLESRLKKTGALAEPEIMSLISGLADAIKCLHRNSIVHRDIKPSNILYVGGIAKLADIGLASSGDKSVSIAGTIHFIPPEKSTGFEADIYALGKVLYCAFTGLGVDKFPSLPEDLDSSRSAKFNQIALKACSALQDERFKDIDEFQEAVRGEFRYGPGFRAVLKNRKYLLYAALIFITMWLIAISYLMYSEKERRNRLIKETVEDANKSIADINAITFDDSNYKLPSEEENIKLKRKYPNENDINKLEKKETSAEAYNSFASGKAINLSTPAKK